MYQATLTRCHRLHQGQGIRHQGCLTKHASQHSSLTFDSLHHNSSSVHSQVSTEIYNRESFHEQEDMDN